MSKNTFFKTPFWSSFQNQRPDPKVCGERSWLPISKMVWHFTIGSVVWMLELSKVGCEDLASSENKFLKVFFTPFWDPFQNRKPDPKVCGENTWLPTYKMVWHLTISSAVWMLDLSKVGCEDLQRFLWSFLESRSRTLGSILGRFWRLRFYNPTETNLKRIIWSIQLCQDEGLNLSSVSHQKPRTKLSVLLLWDCCQIFAGLSKHLPVFLSGTENIGGGGGGGGWQ